jgi:indolepyruvate ferredoxin oxidoreductase
MKLGGWFAEPLKKFASWKTLRGTPWDIFGYAALRRQERALIGWYRDLVRRVLDRVNTDNLALAREIVLLPDQIRGYEHIKLASIKAVQQLAEEKLAQLAQASLPVLGRP